MSWQNYFNEIACINLPERKDRKIRIMDVFREYKLNYFIWEAYKHEKGYFGLVNTMKHLFKSCLESHFKNILVFEDDVKFVVQPQTFHETMDKVVEDLKIVDWDILYLGLQHSKPFNSFRTPNLLPVTCGYSTHACAYSKRAIQFFMESHIDEPIDNFLVREFQPYGTCFATYPLLVSQINGYSDIGNAEIDWGTMYIEPMYEKNVRHLFERKT